MALNESYLLINLDTAGLPGTQYAVTVERGLSADGPWTNQDVIPLLGEKAHWYDNTVPMGVDVWYRFSFLEGTATWPAEIDGPFSLPALGRVWVKDPLRMWADIPMDFCNVVEGVHSAECADPENAFVWIGLADEQWDSDASLFPVLNAEHPADIWARRKHADGQFQFMTRTLAAKDRVYDLMTAGGPLFLQLPTVYGWADAFIQPGTVRSAHLYDDQRKPHRIWTVPFTIVDPVAGPGQGTECANWCAVEDAFPTFAALAAGGGTYSQLAQGVTLCGAPGEDGFGEGLYGDGPYGD